jgi:hypothetical protein
MGASSVTRLDIVERLSAAAASRHPAYPAADATEREKPSAKPSSGWAEGHGRFNVEDWRAESFLKRLGYAVGEGGLSATRRAEILMRAFELPLPADLPAEYKRECGASGSSERLQRIANHLHACIALAKPRRANMQKAIGDWSSDLRWLKAQLGPRHPRVSFGDP